MAKKGKTIGGASPASRGVTLPAPDGDLGLDGYVAGARRIGGRLVRTMTPGRAGTAAPALVRDTVTDRTGTDAQTGEPTFQRARVWRVEVNPSLRALHPDLCAAVLAYADAVEALDGGKVQDFASAGGGASGPSDPTTARLANAEFVRRCEAALAGHELRIVWTHFSRAGAPGETRTRTLPYRDLVRQVALDGMGRAAILRAMDAASGGEKAFERHVGRVAIAITDAARRLAVVQGIVAARAIEDNRATEGGSLV